ncbi:MAG TPA: hypothetical protein VGD58_11735 [Herpetosiphonaceae bacterium]
MQRDDNHSRPQLTRNRWIDLCGAWQFAYDDKNRGLSQGWMGKPDGFDRTIMVPFPPESTAIGLGETDDHPVVWYRRTFTLDAADRQQGLLLHFGVVDYLVQVWVNGHLSRQPSDRWILLHPTHGYGAGNERLAARRPHTET